MNQMTRSAQSAVGDYNDPFASAGDGAGTTRFAKFKGASGDFLVGQAEEEIEHGTRFAANIPGAKYTWSFWWEEEVLEKLEARLVDHPRAFEEEPDHLPDDYDGDMSLDEIRKAQADRDTNFMDGWGCAASVELFDLDDGESITLQLNQGVAMRGFRNMVSSYAKKRKLHPGKYPIIELDADEYKSKVKGVGKRYAPNLKIVGWIAEDDLHSGDDDAYGDGDGGEDQKQIAADAPAATTDDDGDGGDAGDADASEAPPRRRGQRAKFGG